ARVAAPQRQGLPPGDQRQARGRGGGQAAEGALGERAGVRLPGALPAAEQGRRAPHRGQRELGPRRRPLPHAPPPGARPEPQTSRVQISEKGAEISLIPAPPFRIASQSFLITVFLHLAWGWDNS